MLKYSILAATLCITAIASPFTHANEHEQMMQQMMQMQSCMAENVDASYLEGMAKNSEKMVDQIKQLCQSGQRQKAQDTAIVFAKDMQKNPNFQAMQKCMTQLGGAFPSVQAMQEDFDLDDLNKNHVCDDL
ncbi:hypothetical protein [Denitrificimonas caeni]|uniref:hypothetical protein n=1 Tax=Denitrificimonas caeni TaxID=521720 RepID=UPI001965810A|nr:hypothetical protein [Denitrificimonas caeni]